MTEQSGIKAALGRAGAVLNAPRSRRFGKGLAVFFLFFGLFGFFAAPPLLKSVLLKQLSQALHREVSIARIDINPFALSARIEGMSVKAAGGKEVVGFDELYVNLSTFSIFQAGLIVDEIRLQGPRLAVARVAEGRYDISDLLDAWMKPKEAPDDEPPPRFSLNNIKVMGGRIEFDDQPEASKHTVSDINFGVPFISSLPYQAEVLVQPSFSAVFNDAPISLKGHGKPFSGQHESELDIDIDRLDLAAFQPYLPDSLPLRLTAGRLDTALKLVFKALPEKVFSLAVVGSAHLSDLVVDESNGQPLLGWKRLDIDLDNADPINRNIAVKRVALDGLAVTLAVGPQGELNVLTVADKLSGPSAKTATPTPAAKPLAWSLGQFALSDALVRWNDRSRPVPVLGEIRHLNATTGRVDSRLADPLEIVELSSQIDIGERFRMDKLRLTGIKVDLAAHRIAIAEASASQPRLRMARNKAGQVEWLTAPALKPGKPAAARAPAGKAPDWVGDLGKLLVEDLSLRFEDLATTPAAVQEIDALTLRAENLSNAPGRKGTLALQGKINRQGSLDVVGSLQLAPLAVTLGVQTQTIPLLPLQPYFGEQLNIALTRGKLSSKGEVTAQVDKDNVKAAYKGSLTLGDFLAVDKLNSADFLKWKSLYLGAIDFRLQPMAINIGEIALSDFYSRLILNAAGRLNVQDIVKQPEGDAGETAKAAGAAESKPDARPAVPIRIAKITLQNGTVNFSDFFVKPNYTVNLGKLGGRITGLSSADDTVADMDLRGSYANLAPVQIMAKLNPLAAKSFLDLKAEVTGVDLVGFTPYSGKYAGYAIEKGKLSLNLAYKLENKLLTADNRLFIDQFTFGDKIESPDATKLPVNLAISLLKNNRGEIDINLPISGSLDDPEFSVGGLILKVIANLFVKAVTSPFALLGSMFGSGEELSNVEFAPGRAGIDAVAAKKLAVLARALSERESLKLEISGRSDSETDREGLKRVAIERAMKAEKLQDMLKKSGEGVSLESIEIAPDEYKPYLTRAYKQARFPKPRNVIGLPKDLPVEEMEKLMLANFPVSEEDIQQLAKQRAERVQLWLIEQGKVAAGRLFLVPPKVEADDKSKASRVDFSLR